jgi:hypothetical protein
MFTKMASTLPKAVIGSYFWRKVVSVRPTSEGWITNWGVAGGSLFHLTGEIWSRIRWLRPRVETFLRNHHHKAVKVGPQKLNLSNCSKGSSWNNTETKEFVSKSARISSVTVIYHSAKYSSPFPRKINNNFTQKKFAGISVILLQKGMASVDLALPFPLKRKKKTIHRFHFLNKI